METAAGNMLAEAARFGNYGILLHIVLEPTAQCQEPRFCSTVVAGMIPRALGKLCRDEGFRVATAQS